MQINRSQLPLCGVMWSTISAGVCLPSARHQRHQGSADSTSRRKAAQTFSEYQRLQGCCLSRSLSWRRHAEGHGSPTGWPLLQVGHQRIAFMPMLPPPVRPLSPLLPLLPAAATVLCPAGRVAGVGLDSRGPSPRTIARWR